MIQDIDKEWVKAHPCAAVEMIARLTQERDDAEEIARATARDSAAQIVDAERYRFIKSNIAWRTSHVENPRNADHQLWGWSFHSLVNRGQAPNFDHAIDAARATAAEQAAK